MGDWQDDAACRGTGPELFFGRAHESPAEKETRLATAAAVCAACPVRAECFVYAVAADEFVHAGMWGGVVFKFNDPDTIRPATISKLCTQCREVFEVERRPFGEGRPPDVCSEECRLARKVEQQIGRDNQRRRQYERAS